MATLHHIVIPVKDQEQLNKARDVFVNIFGFKVVREGELPKKPRDQMTEVEKRLPDFFCHLYDSNGLCLDIAVLGKGNPMKGVALGFQVDNIKATWDSLKNYPLKGTFKPIYEPISYPEYGLESLNLKSGYFGFIDLKIGRVSNDGEEQMIELVELNPK